MATSIKAVFDGEVFRPVEPVDLAPNATYTISVDVAESESEEHPLTAIRRLAKDMGVEDLSINHDWYAHGRIPGPPDAE